MPNLLLNSFRNIGYNVYSPNVGGFAPYRVVERWARIDEDPRPDEYTLAEVEKLPATQVSTAPGLAPRYANAREPYPGFTPPLFQPAYQPMPAVRPGSTRREKPVMDQDIDYGYNHATTPRVQEPPWLVAQRPPPRTREKKVKAGTSQAYRAIQWGLHLATESADYAEAVFSALPHWRIHQIYNARRKVELTRQNGLVTGARFRYTALTPQEKLQYVWKHFDEVDAVEAVWNINIMNNQDRFWGAASSRMGFERGPAGEYIYPPEDYGEFEEFYPWMDDEVTHNDWVINSETGLTRNEYDKIEDMYQSYLDKNGEWVSDEANSGVIW